MVIVHVISSMGAGGRERRLAQLSMALSSHSNCRQYIVTLADENVYSEILDINVTILSIGKNKRRIVSNFFMVLKKIRPDILHLWTEIPIILVISSLFKFYFRYVLVVGFIADGNPISKLLYKISSKISFICSDCVISNSKNGLIAKKAPLKKSYVIYNGFDFERFKKNNRQKEDLLGELGINSGFIVTMVARFNAAKDYDMFINVAERFSRIRRDVTFVAVGKGENFEEIFNKVELLGLKNVVLTGQRSDVEQILLASDIGVLFTNEKIHAEGISNSIMESMAAELPVVATMGGGTPEIINDKINGFIIQPGDINGAVSSIEMLLNSEELRCAIGREAKKTIKERFLLSSMTNEYYNLYKTLINENPSHYLFS